MLVSDDALTVSDIISLQNIKDICRDTLKNHPDISCYLFGSYAKNKPTIYSDIDLLLLFDENIYDYKTICNIKNELQSSFKLINKYCNPIYGYKNNINNDSSILLRQYIHYGILISGQDMLPLMKKESQEQLKKLEYSNYWTPMYLKKLETIKHMIDNDLDLDDSSLAWQYLFLSTYWYAKAQLTLIDKQNSLNNFTLVHIYTKLLKINLTTKQKKVLSCIQKQRDDYKNFEYFTIPEISFLDSFKVAQDIMKIKYS